MSQCVRSGRGEVLPADMVWEADRLCDESAVARARLARRIDMRISAPLGKLATNRGTGADDASGGCCASSPAATCCGLRAEPARRARPRRGARSPRAHGGGAARRRGPGHHRRTGGRRVRRPTPLWFYVLREAEVQGEGNSLGHVGSRILTETIVGLLLGDPASYLNDDTPWDPSQGVTLPDGRAIRTIRDFLQFTGMPA